MADLNLTPAKYPISLVEKVEDLEMIVSLQRQSGKLSIVGIVGLGGVGKTTIAKEFFNRQISNYYRSCFLSDVRSRSLHSIQRILLKDLCQVDVLINNVDEGIAQLKRRLSSHQVLMVLDDVDHIDQAYALLSPVTDTIDPGSLILVTSRDRRVLTMSGISESSVYRLRCLDRQHSRELFCLHAFGQPHPVVGFEEVVEKSLGVCDGLPLSLKVFGAFFRGIDDLHYWNAQLRKASKMLPSDIPSSLRLSYDALDEEEKQIFLDIACFFVGEEMDTAIRIWDGSGWEGLLGFRKLENRCLVEVDRENCLRMHDHLRDLGREMAVNSNHPRRLWRPPYNPLHNVFDQSTVIQVRGISMIHMIHGNDPEQSFEDLAHSCNLSTLQLLMADSFFVERVFSVGNLPQLIYLRWEHCPYTSIPSSMPTRNLRVLYIKGANLKTLWKHQSEGIPREQVEY